MDKLYYELTFSNLIEADISSDTYDEATPVELNLRFKTLSTLTISKKYDNILNKRRGNLRTIKEINLTVIFDMNKW